MNYKEYIQATLVKFNIGESEIDILLIDNGLDGNLDVDTVIAKTAIHNNLTTWLPIHSSMDEGNVSEAWNYEAVLMYYSLLSKELGLDNLISSPKEIRDKSNLW